MNLGFSGRNRQRHLVQGISLQKAVGQDVHLAAELARCARILRFRRNQPLIRQDAVDNSLYFLLSGTVAVLVNGREVGTRAAGEHVGEMALIEPGARRSASIIATTPTVAARISEPAFSAIADRYPHLWRSLAIELARRLRQRSRFHTPRNPRPVLFIGSSREALPIAQSVLGQLNNRRIKIVLWSELFVDEDVELCKAHIVNAGFQASRSWTVQQKRVDNWFGSVFESAFLDLQLRGLKPEAVFADAYLSKRLGARLTVDGRVVDHYITRGRPVPEKYQTVMIPGPAGPIEVALKLSPSEFQGSFEGRWGFEYETDLRIPAFVSLLKAAHLTLFAMLGYDWALSPGGRFLGKSLGDFYLANRDLPRKKAFANARPYFRPFGAMLRPAVGPSYEGSVDDNRLFFCEEGSIRWGLIILIRTEARALHAVLVPRFEDGGESAFRRFLSDPREQIVARRAQFRGDSWVALRETETFPCPKTELLYPDDDER